MKRSTVIQELLDSYYFQYGKKTDTKVVSKAKHMIDIFKKEEEKLEKKK